jgi:hypothetical protein
MSDSNLTTVLVGGAAFLLAAYFFNKRKSDGRMPPGPKGWPLYGNLLDIKKLDAHKPAIFDKWAKEFGNIYR